jgi:hypothetical protein
MTMSRQETSLAGAGAMVEGHGGVPCLPRARTSAPDGGGLRRPRLLHALDDVRRARFGLVVAPPGAGKTTLLAQWAAGCGDDVAWLRVDRDDGPPGRLTTRLAEALQAHLPAGERPATVAQLAVALDHRPAPLVVVLDDLHTAAGTHAEAELEQLLLLAPQHVRVLVGSRRWPSVNLARFELPRAVHVSADDLAFRSWEAERLFTEVYRVPLHPDDAVDLVRRTAAGPPGCTCSTSPPRAQRRPRGVPRLPRWRAGRCTRPGTSRARCSRTCPARPAASSSGPRCCPR